MKNVQQKAPQPGKYAYTRTVLIYITLMEPWKSVLWYFDQHKMLPSK